MHIGNSRLELSGLTHTFGHGSFVDPSLRFSSKTKEEPTLNLAKSIPPFSKDKSFQLSSPCERKWQHGNDFRGLPLSTWEDFIPGQHFVGGTTHNVAETLCTIKVTLQTYMVVPTGTVTVHFLCLM